MYRIGNGYDVHRFEKGRKLIIGGIEIPYEKGLAGHSDADVLVHAVIDALLGAMGEKDIGTFFPDSDMKLKNIDSCILLEKVMEIMKNKNYKIINIDSIIVAQKPKMMPYIDEMKKKLSKIMKIKEENIGIKAKTEEMLGFTGREEGIKSYAVAMLCKID